ncbi:5-(carboxyamino)imidazole ribonucleotide synthase [Methylogaea oryzae]|uniref:N5-carboxyaminoimidazole ribonucleotide synthase n=1 Tax=Methylogaea oryzae TaxID=1295382 RepID=A0A8D5AJL0_9GAMM|nr:5-(carboxyamino)imidazole ribonucleotide synthase [Methylogaea oryzae]BBL72521.1 N5-carboxyaminoimidazole ribonucleotide synthase [Methylogaea oryzae]
MILPGATLGMLGGGQLGRMFTVAARTMGYRVIVLDPDPNSPAGSFADEHLCQPYDDQEALDYMGRECAAVTTEFENIPASSLDHLGGSCIVRPGHGAIAVTQDRILEKNFLRDNGFGTAKTVAVRTADDLAAAFAEVGSPALLKTARFGYDGKGQHLGRSLEELAEAYERFGNVPCVLEEFLDLDKEISVVIGRGADGQTTAYAPAENRHRNGILDVSIAPARIDPATAEKACAMAQAIGTRLDYCGVLAVEFFVLKDGHLLVNEIAPRPHNSGHYTLDACSCSQFEQQVRTLCGLPLGDTRPLRPSVMVNLLGDVWREDGPPPWETILGHPRAKLHLYGKQEARVGRKMGHYTVLGETVEEALTDALAIRAQLLPDSP